jgi:hypothetical protein
VAAPWDRLRRTADNAAVCACRTPAARRRRSRRPRIHGHTFEFTADRDDWGLEAPGFAMECITGQLSDTLPYTRNRQYVMTYCRGWRLPQRVRGREAVERSQGASPGRHGVLGCLVDPVCQGPARCRPRRRRACTGRRGVDRVRRDESRSRLRSAPDRRHADRRPSPTAGTADYRTCAAAPDPNELPELADTTDTAPPTADPSRPNSS